MTKLPELKSGLTLPEQDFSEWNDSAKEEVVTVSGKQFIFKTPADSDDVINALVNTDKSKSLKALCEAVVSSPVISTMWDKWGIGRKMALTAAVNKFLGLDEDFLENTKKKK